MFFLFVFVLGFVFKMYKKDKTPLRLESLSCCFSKLSLLCFLDQNVLSLFQDLELMSEVFNVWLFILICCHIRDDIVWLQTVLFGL